MTQRLRRALVALGSNLPFGQLAGASLLRAALDAIEARGLPIITASSVWRTPAWPPSETMSDQPDFANAVVAIDAGDLTPETLYAVLAEIEQAFGRERRERWAARTLDLDLIDLDGEKGDFRGIILPHPRAQERAFVLAPLSEVAPDWRPEPDGLTAGEILAALPDRDAPQRMEALR